MVLRKVPIAITIGETKEITLIVTRASDGERRSLTGCILHARIRADLDDAAVVFEAETDGGITHATQSGETLGEAVLLIGEAVTSDLAEGNYVWDAWYEDALGREQPLIAPSLCAVSKGVWAP